MCRNTLLLGNVASDAELVLKTCGLESVRADEARLQGSYLMDFATRQDSVLDLGGSQ